MSVSCTLSSYGQVALSIYVGQVLYFITLGVTASCVNEVKGKVKVLFVPSFLIKLNQRKLNLFVAWCEKCCAFFHVEYVIHKVGIVNHKSEELILARSLFIGDSSLYEMTEAV